MCTVSWLTHQTEGGGEAYDLFFNRDELKSRLPATPPRIHTSPGNGRYICANDGNRGGTWLFVNSRGLTVGLLNYYDAQARQQPGSASSYLSRGHLVLSLVDCRSTTEVEQSLQSADLSAYRPFHLISLSPGFPPLAATWDGHSFLTSPDASSSLPFTTSSFDSSNIVAQRRSLFRDSGPRSVSELEAYHRTFDPERGAQSVCMMRPDAQTWSISRIHVDEAGIQYDYEARDRDVLDFAPVVSCHLARS